MVSDYKLIYYALVENGNKFAGRKATTVLDQHTGVASSVATIQPDETWRHIRKVSHRYMKQFGDGMSRLEEILLQNADYMLDEFESHVEQPMNIMGVLKSTALRSISVLLLGRALTTSDPILDMLLRFEEEVMKVSKTSLVHC